MLKEGEILKTTESKTSIEPELGMGLDEMKYSKLMLMTTLDGVGVIKNQG